MKRNETHEEREKKRKNERGTKTVSKREKNYMNITFTIYKTRFQPNGKGENCWAESRAQSLAQAPPTHSDSEAKGKKI